MKAFRWLSLFVLALSFAPQTASADESSLAERMQRHVEDDLVKPLAQHDASASRFSRARPPPRERRVRMTETTTSRDAAGRAFLPFAIDERFVGGEWRENDVTGCVYTEKGDMFVKVGDGFRPASFLLGVAAEPTPVVCKAAPAHA